jgi:hypothetical protein
MAKQHCDFPFFNQTEPRALSKVEHSVVERLAADLDSNYKTQLANLVVVGRCGCGRCPTIFFRSHTEGDRERDLVSFVGRDSTGGLVAAVLLENEGTLSQLDFYSLDGHDPWFIPEAPTLTPFQ